MKVLYISLCVKPARQLKGAALEEYGMMFRSPYVGSVIFTLVMLSVIGGGVGLDCFKCLSGWTSRECMQNDPETCGWGQICATTVDRGAFSGVRYDKGCMEAGQCYSLQTLNNRKLCDQDPNVCVYCCESELCNAAVMSLPVGAILYMLMSCLVLTLLCC